MRVETQITKRHSIRLTRKSLIEVLAEAGTFVPSTAKVQFEIPGGPGGWGEAVDVSDSNPILITWVEEEADKLFRSDADKIIEIMYSDSCIYLDVDTLIKLLREDAGDGKPFESEDEIERFCFGGNDGEIPVELASRFPRTTAYLNSFF